MVLVHSVPTCRASKVTAETGSGPFYVCTVMLQIRKKQKMLDSLSRIFFVSKATESVFSDLVLFIVLGGIPVHTEYRFFIFVI